MALTSSPPINLLAIQSEFSSGSLSAASTAAGLNPLPTSMLDFLGLGSYTPQLRVDSSTAFTDTTFTVPAGTPAGTTYYYVLAGGGGAGGYVNQGKARQSRGGGGGACEPALSRAGGSGGLAAPGSLAQCGHGRRQRAPPVRAPCTPMRPRADAIQSLPPRGH